MCLRLQKKILDDISCRKCYYRKGATIVFSQVLWFRKEKPQFQMQEESVVQENSKTLRWKIWKQNF